MLNKKVLLVLIIACCLLLAILFFNQNSVNFTTGKNNEQFLPNLSNQLANIDTIQIDSTDESITLSNLNGRWVIKSKHDYPADIGQIRQLLYGLAELNIVELKTSNELLLGEIGLANNHDDSVRIRLSINGQPQQFDILFGKSKASLTKEGTDWFARHYQSSQSWLVNGKLSLHKSAYPWLNKAVLPLHSDNLKQLELRTNTDEAVKIIKSDQDAEFQLFGLIDDEKTESYKIDQVINAVSNIQLDDVRPLKTGSLVTDLPVVIIETTTGLKIAIQITDSQNGWITLMASSTVEDEEITKSAQIYNDQWMNWEYQIPKFKLEQMMKKKRDFLESEPQE